MARTLPRGSFQVEDCRGLTLGHALFNINNLQEEMVECMLTILQMMPNWGGAVCTGEGRAATQRNLDRQEEQADRDLMKFSKDKC